MNNKNRTYQANIKFGQTFNIGNNAPIDDRLVVNNISDLTDPDIWKNDQGACYTYKGMIVSVASTGEVYVFKGASGNTAASNEEGYSDSVCNSLNWVKLASNSGSTILLTSSTGSSDDAYSKQYTLKQGETTIGTIDIPKDMVVESGQIVNIIKNTTNNKYYEDTDSTYDNEITGVTEGKYIKLVLANSDSILYIAVNDLVDVYTAPTYLSGDDHENDSIQIHIDSNNVITGSVKNGTITKANLVTTVQNSLDAADSALQTVSNGTYISLSKSGTNITPSLTISDINNTNSFYSEEGAASYNETLTGAVHKGDSVPDDYKTKVGTAAIDSTLTEEEAIAYNAKLTGAVKKDDLKSGNDGLIKASDLIKYVGSTISGADQALYYITKSGNYINVTEKGTDDDNPDTIDTHHQQISLTFGSATGLYNSASTANQGIVDTALLREALTWE